MYTFLIVFSSKLGHGNFNRMFEGNQSEGKEPLEWFILVLMNGEEILQWDTQRLDFHVNGGVENSSDDLVKFHGVKSCKVLSDLPYWTLNAFLISKSIANKYHRY